jgi:protein-S-isoprenylcysteine O-methyltransferase Ste14
MIHIGRDVIFISLSVLIVIVSWRTLLTIKSHGFYRFFSLECIAWLFAANSKYWFNNPFGYQQIFSWIFLFLSGYLVVAGAIQLKRKGKPKSSRKEKTLYKIEQTTELVDTCIYRYIRHPLYSSLLFLTWGIYLKNASTELLLISVLSTIFLYMTAIFEEKECILFFGDAYKDYMKKSKMFIPFLI